MFKGLRESLQWNKKYTKGYIKWSEILGGICVCMGLLVPLSVWISPTMEMGKLDVAMTVAAISFGMILLNDSNHIKNFHSDVIGK
jgi:hypothetical protein